MRHRPLLALAALVLAACQVKAPDAVRASSKPVATKASNVPAPTPPQLLKAGDGTLALAGQVFMDAGYARAHGDGRPVGGAIGLDGAHMANGAIANANGQIVAQGGGNVIVPAGIISNDGGSLIGNDGGGIISNDGGSVISNDGASYHLAQAAEGLGASVPAAGMWVSVVDGRSGQPLPLGVDDAGKPVTAIYTDAEGRFAVHLPADAAANVRVVARAPGSADPRLALHVLETPKAGGQAVTEARAAATGYLRYLIADLMVKLANRPVEQVTALLAQAVPAGSTGPAAQLFLGAASGTLGLIHDAMAKAGFPSLPPPRQYDLALRAADLLLADMDLVGTKLDFSFYQPLEPASAARAGQPAFEGFVEALEALRVAAARAGGTDPVGFAAYFATKPYVLAANADHPELCRTIAKPADVGDFVVKEYFATADLTRIAPVNHVYYDLGVPTTSIDLLRASGFRLYVEMTQRLLLAPEGEKPLAEQIAEMIKREAPPLEPLPPPPAPATCALASAAPTPGAPGRVSTVAGPMDGKPAAGEVDGPGASARFNAPTAMAYDAAANVAYVADANGQALRRLRFDAAGAATVDTVRQGVGPYDGLLLAGDKLYASDGAQHRVVRFDLPGFTGPTVVATGLTTPTSLVLHPDGDLLVADTEANRVVRIRLQAPGSAPEPFFGNGLRGELDAEQAAEARMDSPRAMAIAPDGQLYVSSFSQGQIHVVDTRNGRTHFLAGGRTEGQHQDGFWANASTPVARSMAWDPRGHLILADGVGRLRTVSLHGDVLTLLGRIDPNNHVYQGFKDGPADQALAGFIHSVAPLPDGGILFTDGSAGAIRRWQP